jgi:hypothetical protein
MMVHLAALPAINNRHARIDPLSKRFVGHSASFPSLGGSRMAAGLSLAVAARLRAFAREAGAAVAALLRPTQKQHKFGCRRRSTRR